MCAWPSIVHIPSENHLSAVSVEFGVPVACQATTVAAWENASKSFNASISQHLKKSLENTSASPAFKLAIEWPRRGLYPPATGTGYSPRPVGALPIKAHCPLLQPEKGGVAMDLRKNANSILWLHHVLLHLAVSQKGTV